MTRAVPSLLIAAMLVTTIPSIADAFSGKRNTRVNPVNSAVFEVYGRGGMSGENFWCGAADYAHRALGAQWSATLYIARGRAPGETVNKKSTVQFTLDPGAAGITPERPSLSLNSLKVGDNMSVQAAYQYCAMPPTRF